MEDYNKIIESLTVRFNKAKNINILKTLSIENYYDVLNTIILVNNGEITFGKEKEKAVTGEIVFVPGGKMIPIAYGSGDPDVMTNDDFISNKEHYFEHNTELSYSNSRENFTYITFDAKVFDSVNFFASLDIPPFKIVSNRIASIIKQINEENLSEQAGKNRLVKIASEMLVVETIRYVLAEKLFVEQLATNVTYFKDPRLINIFAYIKDHLGEDLSNKTLAAVANVSEDYVGQYFKMLTGINPQDYIEYQRMEGAVNLLRTTKKSIREIGKEVGYKDTAYFCRRFKMMFGIPAGKMRRRESLMNV